jgi:hypothetical protein
LNFNITFRYTPRSSTFSLSLTFPHQNPACASLYLHTRQIIRPSYCS